MIYSESQRSLGPLLHMTQGLLAKELKQHVLWSGVKVSKRYKKAAVESLTHRSQPGATFWNVPQHSWRNSLNASCVTPEQPIGDLLGRRYGNRTEGEGKGTWWSLQQRADRLPDYFGPVRSSEEHCYIWNKMSSLTRNTYFFNSRPSCCGTPISLKEWHSAQGMKKCICSFPWIRMFLRMLRNDKSLRLCTDFNYFNL